MNAFGINKFDYWRGKSMARISMEDVAERAGVSITTVSRVLNNTNHPVSEKTRKKVMKVIQELDYKPDISAQSLRQSFNNIIALITRDISDPYFGEMARGVTETANKYGILTFVCNTGRNPENEIQYHELLWQHRVRGIILGGGGLNLEAYKIKLQEQMNRYKDNGHKIVSLAPQGFDMDYVMIDNRGTGELITDYLIARGHTSIAYISGPQNTYTAFDRLEGYKLCLKKHNLPYDDLMIAYSDNSWKGGYEAANILLDRSIKFTGICCGNDNLAVGALRAFKERGLAVPEDVSVISIGDLPNANYTAPPLTTVRVPLYEMGAKAVNIIMSDDTQEYNANIIFKTVISERQSVSNIK
ncbi:LacI family DNA-binding transcriptional regulator [Pelosinus fermentans]|nr:LacI family DNA-binding transcriptional regulator [Pelosinus fermentans]